MSAPFRFKQFIVEQDTAPFKVGTDGVHLGAWSNHQKPQRILDVGTGTGVVALMVAQRFSSAHIDALEINDKALGWAKKNFNSSPWTERLNPIHHSFENWECDNLYDLMVCNPPFFNTSQLSNDYDKNLARQQVEFNINSFLRFSKEHLKSDGVLAVVIPCDVYSEWSSTAETVGLFVRRKCYVRPTPDKPAKRVLFEFSQLQETRLEFSDLVLELSRHQFSPQAKNLLQDFYLNL